MKTTKTPKHNTFLVKPWSSLGQASAIPLQTQSSTFIISSRPNSITFNTNFKSSSITFRNLGQIQSHYPASLTVVDPGQTNSIWSQVLTIDTSTHLLYVCKMSAQPDHPSFICWKPKLGKSLRFLSTQPILAPFVTPKCV